MKTLSIFMMALLTCLFSYGQMGKTAYKISNRFSVEGDGSWDYLTIDDSTHHLFISHGNIVQVLDVKTGKVLGFIPDTKGVHGIALARDLDKGFISNGRDTSVTVIDLKKLTIIEKVKVTGNNPDAILYDIFTHRIFTFNGRSSNATVLDARTDKVIGTIPLEGKPEFAVSDGHGKVYVNIEDKSKLCLIDPQTMKVEQSWPLAPGDGPSGLALDDKTHRLFSVCDKLMVVVDALTGKVITTLPIGDRVDGVAFDPGEKCAYSSNGDGTMTVVQEENENTFKVLENVKTQKGARTITLDKSTHKIYLPTAEFGETPLATKENPHPRPSIKPGSFVILELVPVKY
ncbi:MAG: YncE family protein [Bacteroidia bacterium]|nr:YncE family protein [Bacteroidia bacterium]